MLLLFLLCSVASRARSGAVRSIYKNNGDFRLHIQSHMAVALHSCLCLVCQTWSDDSTQYADNDAVVAFHLCFRNTWLDSMFPVALWNSMAPTHRCTRTTMLNRGMHALIALFAVHIRICTCSLRILNRKNVLLAQRLRSCVVDVPLQSTTLNTTLSIVA